MIWLCLMLVLHLCILYSSWKSFVMLLLTCKVFPWRYSAIQWLHCWERVVFWKRILHCFVSMSQNHMWIEIFLNGIIVCGIFQCKKRILHEQSNKTKPTFVYTRFIYIMLQLKCSALMNSPGTAIRLLSLKICPFLWSSFVELSMYVYLVVTSDHVKI